MNNPARQEQPSTELAITDPDTIRLFAQMASMVPTEDAPAYDRILAQILQAEHWADLDTPWEADKAEAILGRILRIDRIERRPSDFRQGLGIFLVCHYIDTTSGEKGVITTGSVAVVAQLVRAWALGVFPVFVEFVVAERPTADGYRPHHLKFHDAVTKEPANAQA